MGNFFSKNFDFCDDISQLVNTELPCNWNMFETNAYTLSGREIFGQKFLHYPKFCSKLSIFFAFTPFNGLKLSGRNFCHRSEISAKI